MSYEELEHDEEYVAALAPFIPRACPTNFDGDMEKKKEKGIEKFTRMGASRR